MRKIYPLPELAFYAVVLIIVTLTILLNGPAVQMRFGHDVPSVIDAVWRMQHGQIPHTDFYSILGCAYIGQQYIFLRLFNYNLMGLSVSSLALTFVALSIFFSLLYAYKPAGNFGWVLRVYTFLLIISLGLGQYHMGQGYKAITYANLYNRYCFLILLICFLIFNYLQSITAEGAKFYIYSFIAALLLNYLLFSKLTYFLVAVFILTVYLAFRFFTFKKYLILLLNWGVLFVLILAVFKVNVIAMLKDYGTISKVHTGTFFSKDLLLSKFYRRYDLIIIAAWLFLIVQMIIKKVPLKQIIIVLLLGAFSAAFHLTNFGDKDIVFLNLLPCFFISFPLQQYRGLLAYKVLLVAGCIFIAENFASIYYLNVARKSTYSDIKGYAVSGFYVHLADGSCNKNNLDYSNKINSGVSLINAYKKPGDRVFVYDFDNIFPALTNTLSPKNTLLVWQYQMTFSEKVHPGNTENFSDVSLILIPTCDDPISSLPMKNIYSAEVNKHFKKVKETTDWVLLRKYQ